MLLDLLQQEGLSARIHGEHLQGAMGELPAAGLVSLVIPEEEFAAAREVIARWELAQPAEPVQPTTRVRQGRGGWLLLIGLLLGVGATYAYVRAPVSTDGVDHNRDGLLDEHWTYSPRGTPVRVEIDRNLDTKTDYIAHYDERGLLSTAQSDDDFNGKFETSIAFRSGNVVTVETDTDGDGYPDLVTNYASGVAQTLEYRDPKTGQPLRIEHLKLGKLQFAELDADKDGKLDTRLTYSPLGDELSRSPISR